MIKNKRIISLFMIMIIIVGCFFPSVTPANANLLVNSVLVSDVGEDNSVNYANSSRNIVVDSQGTIYIVFYGDEGIRVAKSVDEGVSFQPSVQVHDKAHEVSIALGSDGVLYVAWVEDNVVMLSRSLDEGASFSIPEELGTGYVSVRIATNGANVYLVSHGWGGVVPDSPFFYYSDDNGESFQSHALKTGSAITDVNVDPLTNEVVIKLSRTAMPFALYYISKDFGQTIQEYEPENVVSDSSTSAIVHQNGNRYLIIAGSFRRGIRINLDSHEQEQLNTFHLSSTNQQSLAADTYGNIVFGYGLNSRVNLAVSRDLGDTFEVLEHRVYTRGDHRGGNITIDPRNGDILIVHPQWDRSRDQIYFSRVKGALEGYELSLSKTHVHFEDEFADDEIVTLTNQSGETISIEDIQTNGEFLINHACQGNLNPGEACQLTISFLPQSIGEKNGSIDIYTDIFNQPRTVRLSGTANQEPSIQKIMLDQGTYSLLVGESTQTVVSAVYTSGQQWTLTDGVMYFSNDTSVAEVNDHGLLTATGTGATVINAVYEGKMTIANVQVDLPVTLTGIEWDEPEYSLVVNGQQQTIITAVYSNGDTFNISDKVNYFIEDEQVVAIDTQGRITALAEGSTSIEAEFNGQTAQTSVVVHAVEPEDPDPDPDPQPQNPAPQTPVTTEPEGAVTEEIMVNVEVGEVGSGTMISSTPIQRVTDENGVIQDFVTLTLEKALETVHELNELGEKTARIYIPDPENKVSEVNVDIPVASLNTLKQGGINLEIYTENARLWIHNSSLTDFQEDLYFRIIPILDVDHQQKIEVKVKTEEKIQEYANDREVYIVDRPLTIETNMENREVAVILPIENESVPVGPSEEEAFWDRMVVFIEHTDGERKIIKGKKVQYKPNQSGVQFVINKFSEFAIVDMINWRIFFEESGQGYRTAYVFGYPDGTFRPLDALTREHAASLISRVMSLKVAELSSTPPAYRDMTEFKSVDDSIWKLTQLGIVTGYPDGTFRPQDAISVAEWSTMLFHCLEKHQCFAEPNSSNLPVTNTIESMKEISGHWAERSIRHLYYQGIIETNEPIQPDAIVTRAEAIVMINRALNRGPVNGIEYPTWSDVDEDFSTFGHIESASRDYFYVKVIETGEEEIR